jgi:hypothetical protein
VRRFGFLGSVFRKSDVAGVECERQLTFGPVEGEGVLVTLTDPCVCNNDIDATIRAGADGMLEHGHLCIPGSDIAFNEGVAVNSGMSDCPWVFMTANIPLVARLFLELFNSLLSSLFVEVCHNDGSSVECSVLD